LITPAAISGCAGHSAYRVYDRDHDDYHNWDDHENGFYLRWENETRRDHRDYKRRDRDDQNQYWNWRHSHPDNDRDHDKH